LLLADPEWARARAAMNAVWSVTTEEALRVQRLVERHLRFGKTELEARAWVADIDQRNSDLVSGTLGNADRIVVNGSNGWSLVE
jgi:pantothenate kinase